MKCKDFLFQLIIRFLIFLNSSLFARIHKNRNEKKWVWPIKNIVIHYNCIFQ